MNADVFLPIYVGLRRLERIQAFHSVRERSVAVCYETAYSKAAIGQQEKKSRAPTGPVNPTATQKLKVYFFLKSYLNASSSIRAMITFLKFT